MSSNPNEASAVNQLDFGGVASRYVPMLYRIAFQQLRNVEDAEDAVQDALLSAYKHISEFEGRSQLSTWLTRIVINAARMKLRSRPRYEAVSLDQHLQGCEADLANELVDAGPNPETICARREMKEAFSRALAEISPKLSVAFQLHEMAGFSTRESAEAIGVTMNALKSRVNRARSAIRLYLDKTDAVNLGEQSDVRAVGRSNVSPYRKNSGARRAVSTQSGDYAAGARLD